MQTRRQFLMTLIAGCFVPAGTAYALPSKASGHLSATGKLSALFGNNGSAMVIGNSYRSFSKTASKNLSGELAALLDFISLSETDFVSMDNGNLLQHIKRVVSKDFEHGNVTQVDGWLLSTTEVQLCHVLSLAPHE